MKKKEDLLILIPARSGSSRVKNKNMKILKKIPLLGHKIKSCIKSNIGDVVVSTDSIKIAKYARKLGAYVPFLRPKRYSTSKASTMSCVLDLLRFYIEKKIRLPKYIGIIPATNPFLNSNTMKTAYKKLLRNNKFNSILSFTNSPAHPFLMIKIKKKIIFNIIKYDDFYDEDFERSQDLPPAFIRSAALKITKTSYFLKFVKNTSPFINKKTYDMNSCLGIKISNKESFDINIPEDFKTAESIA
tara:strand:+ start:1628 stop:2359 length:732 start_codon:yes stop_codon:yes gene_type:complete